MIIPTKFDHQTVGLSEIDVKNSPFRITTNNTVGDLAGAFNQVGLINPPFLLSQSSGYIVVCGHRRVMAAHALAWETIPVRILPVQSDPLICAYLAISENSIERPLNLIETSRALSLLESFIPNADERYRVAQNLGLPSSPSLVKKIKPLCRLSQQIQDGILSDQIALPTALMLSKMPPEASHLLSNLLAKLKLSLNKQKELIVIIQEIAIRDNCSIEDLIKSEEIQGVLNNPEIDLPRKSGLIRTYLRHRRFPHFAGALDSFEKINNSLSLGQNFSLKPPPGFESNYYNITFSFSKISELDRHKQTLKRLIQNDRFRRLLDAKTQENN